MSLIHNIQYLNYFTTLIFFLVIILSNDLDLIFLKKYKLFKKNHHHKKEIRSPSQNTMKKYTQNPYKFILIRKIHPEAKDSTSPAQLFKSTNQHDRTHLLITFNTKQLQTYFNSQMQHQNSKNYIVFNMSYSGGWSIKHNAPSGYPGDAGGNTITYSTSPHSISSSVGVSGNAYVSTDHSPPGGPQISGGGVGVTFHFK